MQERKEDRSLGELFGQLTGQMSTLFRKEVELARTEMTQSATRVGRNAAMAGAGAAVAYAGALAIVYGVIVLLAELGLALWLSSLIVGAVLGVVGFVLIQRGREQLQGEGLAPKRTIETLKDDADWARERTR